MGNTQRRREAGRGCEKPEEVNKLQAAEFLRQRGDGKGTVQNSILCTGKGGKNLCRDMCKRISRCPFGITSSSLTKPFTPHQLARPPSRLNTREEPSCGKGHFIQSDESTGKAFARLRSFSTCRQEKCLSNTVQFSPSAGNLSQRNNQELRDTLICDGIF